MACIWRQVTQSAPFASCKRLLLEAEEARRTILAHFLHLASCSQPRGESRKRQHERGRENQCCHNSLANPRMKSKTGNRKRKGRGRMRVHLSSSSGWLKGVPTATASHLLPTLDLSLLHASPQFRTWLQRQGKVPPTCIMGHFLLIRLGPVEVSNRSFAEQRRLHSNWR